MTLVVVSGAIADKPFQGGSTWVRLSWLRGLEKLGCQVFLIDQTAAPAKALRRTGGSASTGSPGQAYFQNVVSDFEFAGRAALITSDGQELYGPSLAELHELASQADALVNISGHLRYEPLLRRFRRKVYLDIDPGFTQLWHTDPATPFEVAGHDFYFTIGENIGTHDCPIPMVGIPWRATRQPVVLDDWPLVPADRPDRFTTVANWRGPFGPVQFEGRTWGLKVHEFRKFIELPRCVPYRFELALQLDSADEKDRQSLLENHWELTDPQRAAKDPHAFRSYVQESSAEFSVAQEVYVATRSGWFSDRTVRYLASGKPALVQDTGWSRHLPAGQGLHAFSTMDEAIAGARKIVTSYAEQCAAARRVAAQYFGSDVVVGRLLEEIGINP
jgi:hypothetical protein